MTDREPTSLSLLPDVPPDDDVARTARERTLTALRAQIEAEAEVGTQSTRPRPRPRRRRRAVVFLAAAIAATAAIVVAIGSGIDEGRVAPAESSAAVVLRAAAAAAERAPGTGALRPGQYLYVRRTAMEPRVISRGGERFTIFVRYIDEDWTARDGTGRHRSTPASPGFPTPADRAAWRRAGSPSTREMVGNYLPIVEGTDFRARPNPRHVFPARAGGLGLTYAQVRALPSDPARLGRLLRRQVGSLREYAPLSRERVARTRVLEWIGRLLSGAPVSPDQRAALLRVAAAQPGVRISRDAVDRLGRSGTAVRLEVRVEMNPARPPYRVHPHTRSTTLVVAPQTGELLGTRATFAGEGRRTTADYGAVFSSGVVASTTARP